MTNPNNAIGTNGAFDGRTSPNALNDLASAFTRGIVSGWNCAPKSGMTVQLGGSASVRDVALAEDNAGDKLTINNRSGAPVEITLDGAPATNNRVDAIVAYVDNPSTGDGNTTDNPTACGIIAVSGTVAANPTAPTDEQIRSAITTDGATGGVAYYVILATIRVGTSVTSIGSGVITAGAIAQVAAAQNQAVTTVQDNLTAFEEKFNVMHSITSGKIPATGNADANIVKLAQDSTSSIFKFYGSRTFFSGSVIQYSAITGMSSYYGADTGLVLTTPPTQAYIVENAGYRFQSDNTDANMRTSSPLHIAVGTNGHIYVDPKGSSGNVTIKSGIFERWTFFPCLYFNSTFGDQPG